MRKQMRDCELKVTLIATIKLDFLSLARYTSPKWPLPNGFPISKSRRLHLLVAGRAMLCAEFSLSPPKSRVRSSLSVNNGRLAISNLEALELGAQFRGHCRELLQKSCHSVRSRAEDWNGELAVGGSTRSRSDYQ